MDLPGEIVCHICSYLWDPKDIVHTILTSRLLRLTCETLNRLRIRARAILWRPIHAAILLNSVDIHKIGGNVVSLHTRSDRRIIYDNVCLTQESHRISDVSLFNAVNDKGLLTSLISQYPHSIRYHESKGMTNVFTSLLVSFEFHTLIP